MQLVNRASSRGVLGRIGAFFERARAFFVQIGAFWVRFELVLNPGPKSMVSSCVSLPKTDRPVVKKKRDEIDSFVR